MGELIRPGTNPLPPEGAEIDAHLHHVFDYCRALLGRDDTAATTALAVLTSAHELPDTPQRVRAGLFALARRHALALLPYSDQPPYQVPAATSTSARLPSQFIVSAFAELTYGDREILDLVYRHGIHPADLPAILAIPAEEAYRRLITAEEDFISLAADRSASAGAVLDDIADLPLAALPAPEGDGSRRHRKQAPAIDAALWRALARRRVRIAGAAVIPLVAICWGVVYLAAAGAAGSSREAAVLPAYGAGPPRQVATTPDPTSAAGPARSAPPAIPIALLLPVPRRSGSDGVVLPPPVVSSSPSPTTPPPTTPPPTAPPPTTPPPSTPPPSTPPPTTPPPPSAAPTS